ncbi:MAG TPA: IclR family transcriptional regulator [Gaiellaceae bacterium]|nr:IclR family transcriptional regulator [Gaiellaceae bacterium]
MAKTGQPSTARVASARRSLAILDVLADEPTLGTNEIARRLGTSASTTSRQLATLVEAGLVEHVPATGRYRLGIRLVALATSVLARLDVRAIAHPHLEALAAELGETATLSVPADPDAITVDVVRSPRYITDSSRLGRPSIAHASAAGKVMLAFDGAAPVRELQAYTPRTITDPLELEAEIERVRRRGWAEAFEEREIGLNAIAAPVWSSDGSLAGIIALQGPIPRFGRAAARAALPSLRERAALISAELGSQSG